MVLNVKYAILLVFNVMELLILACTLVLLDLNSKTINARKSANLKMATIT